MLKLYIDESYLFTEAIADIKKYYPNINDDTFMQLISLDPTYRQGSKSAGKYGKWLLNLYNKGNLSEEDFDEVTPLLNQFTTYRNRIQNKDLNSYKSLDALSDVLASVINDDSMLTDRQKVRFLKNIKSGKVTTGKENDYDVVFNNSNWIVCVPNTHEASMKLGKGTSWCTAHENPEWYNAYTYEDGNNYSLFIMKNKHTGEKFQYCDNPYRGNDYQFMDEDDNSVNVVDFITDCEDDDFIDYLYDLNSDFFKKSKRIDDLVIDNDIVVGTADYFEPNVVIPDGVKYIGEEVFYESDNIKSIYISESVRQINSSAFESSSIERIYLDEAYSLKCIEENAFKYCENLEQSIILSNIEYIYDKAFEGSGITSLYIGSNLISIGDEAFCNCTNLEIVTINNCKKPLIIGKLAFANCSNLKTIELPKDISSIDISAFNDCNEDLIIYSDSPWLRDNIENFYVNLYSTDDEPIYIVDEGFVD